MRKIVAGLMMSVDGVVEAPETWTGPYFSPEIGQAVGSLMANGDTMLLGRVTYQTFAASFAGNTSDPMAVQMKATPKGVVSATLHKADWENSTLVKGDVVKEISQLKQLDGPELQVHGSSNLIQTLLKHNLIDEMHMLIFPVSIGYGKRLFGEGTNPASFKLLNSKMSPSGVIIATYAYDGTLKIGSL